MRPDFWNIDTDTNFVLDAKPFTRFQLITRAQSDLQKQTWIKAAAHEDGGGLETGTPSLTEPQNAIRHLRKKGSHTEAKALEYIVVGYFIDPRTEDTGHHTWCKRCGPKQRATRLHTAYHCPDNKNIT